MKQKAWRVKSYASGTFFAMAHGRSERRRGLMLRFGLLHKANNAVFPNAGFWYALLRGRLCVGPGRS